MTERFANNYVTTSIGAIDDTTDPVVITLADTPPAALSSGDWRILVEGELMLATAVSGDDVTCDRAQEGTAIAAHSSGSTVEHVLTAASLAAAGSADYPRSFEVGEYAPTFSLVPPIMPVWPTILRHGLDGTVGDGSIFTASDVVAENDTNETQVNDNTVGSYIEFPVLMEAGTWTLTAYTGEQASNRGELYLKVDGVAVDDWDASLGSYAQGGTPHEVTGVVIASSGLHIVRLEAKTTGYPTMTALNGRRTGA